MELWGGLKETEYQKGTLIGIYEQLNKRMYSEELVRKPNKLFGKHCSLVYVIDSGVNPRAADSISDFSIKGGDWKGMFLSSKECLEHSGRVLVVTDITIENDRNKFAILSKNGERVAVVEYRNYGKSWRILPKII
jgi:hypothetical protein